MPELAKETYQLHLDVGVESRDVEGDGVGDEDGIYCQRKNRANLDFCVRTSLFGARRNISA